MHNIESFISDVNSKDSDVLSDPKINLGELITKEINFNEIHSKLLAAKQDKIRIREIIFESEIDFIKSAQHLKAVFEIELTQAITKVNEIYDCELLKLQTFYRKKLTGEGMMNLIKALNNSEYSLVIMNERIYAYKFYDPYHKVTEGHYQSGMINVYDDPVCFLKGIYVNLLHPKITNGSILINTENRHPNANTKGLSEVCVGNLHGRDIPIDNTEALIALLDEISETYQVMHLDSAYFIPNGNYNIKEGLLKWTA